MDLGAAATYSDAGFARTASRVMQDPFGLRGLTLEELAEPLRDNVGNPVPLDNTIIPRNAQEIALAVDAAVEADHGVVSLGGRSSGTQAFGKPGLKAADHGLRAITGLDLGVVEDPRNKDQVRPFSDYTQNTITEVGADESRLFIHTRKGDKPFMRLVTGPKVSPGGLHRLLDSDEVGTFQLEGKTYKAGIEGWDLTSADIAAAGGAASSGALGPSRMPPSTSIVRAAMARGAGLEVMSQEEFRDHEGLGGTSGQIAALELEPTLKPAYPFALLAPVKGDWAEVYARLQTSLAPALNMRIKDGIVESDWDGGVLRGIEEISRKGLQLYLKVRTVRSQDGKEKRHNDQPDAIKLARNMLAMMDNNQTDRLLMLPGDSFMKDETAFAHDADKHNPWKQLYQLAGYDENFDLTGEAHIGEVAGIINDPEAIGLLKAIRHELPELAREEGAPHSKEDLRYTTSTDYIYTVAERVLELAPDEVIIALRTDIFAIYQAMEREVEDLKSGAIEEGVDLNLYSYGHVPDADLHRRVTVVAQEDTNVATFNRYKTNVDLIMSRLRENLASLMQKQTRVVNGHAADVPSYTRRHGEKGTIKGWAEASEQTKEAALRVWREAGPHFTYRLPSQLQALISQEEAVA